MVDTGSQEDRVVVTDGLQASLTSDERHMHGRASLPFTRGGYVVPSNDGDLVGNHLPSH